MKDVLCEECGKPGGVHIAGCPCDGDEYLRQSVPYCIDCGEDKHPGLTCKEAKGNTRK